ncbi:hypothetical protein CVT24_007372 [Panaeolus cyanescens]|uniref:FAD/NAD(P)-binding domain-containing protein n=1 Tax=Panaeolus cyanescens TaxID=181874 RepID=A0A409YMB5_9AGAR|nr:hypothetical protein CVT24_007372 [Panaeolus cyanescens]
MATESSSDPRLDRPLFDERLVRIICIGAGASGLILAYKLRRSFTNFELVVYEKNEAVGGTWVENTYPGCACDVPAHTYTYSFEPKSDWSSIYASSEEIQQYFEDFSEKYQLQQYIKFNHQVSNATWDDVSGEWKVDALRLDDGQMIQDRCHILVNATGALNAWKWPDIPTLHSFKGPLIHTAKWDNTLDLEGKHVGIIGNGSSALQLLPAIYPSVRKVTNFVRSPIWIAPSFSEPQRQHTEEEKSKFKQDPESHLAFRKAQVSGVFTRWPVFLKDSEAQKITVSMLTQLLKDKLPSYLVDSAIPNVGVGCRRVAPGLDYLEKLSGEKTHVVLGDIERITERGVVDAQGVEHELDILVCATGFDTSSVPRFPIIGLDGVDMRDAWKDEVKGYMGVGASGFPNYFTMAGAGSPSATGPAMIIYELHADYILKMVDRYQTENIHSMTPTVAAVDDYIRHRDEFMKRTTWSEDCRSWFKAGTPPKVTALWPGSGMHWYTVFKQEPRYEDWEWKYKGNRFSYFGNGFAGLELQDPTQVDWASFIRNEDDDPHLSKRAQIAEKASKKAVSN